MARTNAISLYMAANTAATLAEIYGLVIENVQKATLSTALKSTKYNGNPAAGSVEFKRFVNSGSKNYGTARAAGAGDKLTVPPTTVNLNQHKEIVEEVAKFDLDTFGVSNVMGRRADNHVLSMAAALDRAFFSEAAETGAEYEPSTSSLTIQETAEELIQSIETTKNDYVDGVDRNLIDLVLSPVKYGKLRTFLDTQSNPNVDTAGEEFGMYHGVRVYSCTRLPAGIAGICMARESVAQPVVSDQYGAPEKIPLSNDFAVSLFYDYGTKALTPDLIRVWADGAGTLGSLTVASAAGTETAGDTVITVTEDVIPGRKLVYKTNASTAPAVTYDQDLSSWTALPADGLIASTTTGHKITVAEVDSDNSKAKRSGNTSITAKS